MITKRTLNTEIEDVYTRESMTRINEHLTSNPFIKGEFSFYSFSFVNTTGAPLVLTDSQVPHNLGFVPKDLIQTSLVGVSSIAWNFSKFSENDLYVSMTIPANTTVTVRAFVGRYEEESTGG